MPLQQRKTPEADLRKNYTINMQVGLIITLLVLIGLFRTNLNFDTDLNFEEQEQQIVQLEDIVRTQQVETPPPPPRPRAPEPVPDSEILDDDQFDFSFDDQMSSDLPPPPPPPDDEEEERIIFEVVEDEPYPVGGLDAIYNNLQYPEIARRAGIEGVVVIQFIVDEHGNISDFSVLRDIGGGAANAAIDAIQATQWEPGRQRGRAVPVRFQIPIRFVLQSR